MNYNFYHSAQPGSGNVITLAQFIFISVKGFIFESKFGTQKSKIPLRLISNLFSVYKKKYAIKQNILVNMLHWLSCFS